MKAFVARLSASYTHINTLFILFLELKIQYKTFIIEKVGIETWIQQAQVFW